MLYSHTTSIEDRLVFLLAELPYACGPDLYSAYTKRFSAVSRQGMYRALRLMREKGLVVKHGRTYTLCLPWMLDIMDFAENLFNNGFKKKGKAHVVPKGITRKQWKFSCIEDLFHTYAQSLISITTISKQKTMLQYLPHAWFILFFGERWNSFTKKLRTEINHTYTVVGGQNVEDKKIFFHSKDQSGETLYLAPEDERIIKGRTKYLHIIGDFIITILLEKTFADQIDRMYEENTMYDEVLKDLRKEKTKIKLSIKKNPDKVRIYRKKFVQLFGPVS